MCRNFIFLSLLLFLFNAGLPARTPVGAIGGQPSEDPRQEAEGLLTLSAEQNKHDHLLALQTAKDALVLMQNLSDTEGIARAYAQIAQCYMAHSDLSEATQNYEKALELSRELSDRGKEAEALIHLGFIESRKGEWSNAISFFTQAEPLLNETGDDKLRGGIAAGRAHIFRENGLPESALIQYQRALDYYRQTPGTIDDNRMIMLLGHTHYLSGNNVEALTNIQAALTGFEPDSLHAAQCHLYLAKVYGANHEYGAALQHLEIALPLYTHANNPQETAQVLGLMGQIFEKQGNVSRARRYYEKSLSAFTRLFDRLNQAAIYYALGRLELKQRKYEAAEVNLRRSIETIEKIGSGSASTDLTAAFSASVHERYETYVECLMQKHAAQPNQGFAAQAFELSERARARSLAELLQATETNPVSRIDPQLAQREKSVRQSLRAKENYQVTLWGTLYQPEELKALEVELARLRAEHEKVAQTIRERYPAYAELTRPTTWDLQRIQEQVVKDEETVLLEYFLGAERSYVWVVTRSEMTSYELPSQAIITDAATKVYKLLADRPPDTENDLEQAIQVLSQMVLSPVTAQLNHRRIIIAADGALHYIPFQILHPASAKNEPLIAASEVINVPSASILGQLREETVLRQPTKLLAAFGDPKFATNQAQPTSENTANHLVSMPSLENARWRQALRDVEVEGDLPAPVGVRRLFYAKRELNNLARAASGGENLIAVEYDATRERLRSTDLSQFKILHIATHGFFDKKRPQLSGLLLSTVDREQKAVEGFLGLKDIYDLHAPVELVVLSACRTGLGKDVTGEGLIGLTRGFMYAGASSVVASLWEVDDRVTAELMKRFYNNMLQDGMNPAAALRAAQNSIRHEPGWSSPYYWAAFTLQGEPTIKTQPAAETQSHSNIMLFGGLFVLFAVMGWSYHRHFRR